MSPTSATRPWLAQYAPGVPAEFEPEVRNGVELFARGPERRPDGAAIHYFDSTLTHAEGRAIAQAFAAALRDLGVSPGDRVALYLQNVPQFVLALDAVWMLGAIAVPVNPMLKERELAYQLRDCGAKVVVSLEALYETVRVARKDTPVEHVVTTSELDFLEEVPAALSAVRRLETPGAHAFRDLVERYRDTAVEPADPDPGEPAILAYTSGTTGPPKGAMNTHGNVAYNTEVYHRFLGIGPEDVVVAMAPLFHITGLVGHIAIARFCAAPLVLFYRFDAGEMLRLIEKWRGTFSIGALTAYIALLDHPDLARRDISSLSKVFSGGAPVYPAVVERFERTTGLYMHNTYGLTEVTSPSHFTPVGRRAPVDAESGALSVGVPVCGVDSRIVDLATGEDAAARRDRRDRHARAHGRARLLEQARRDGTRDPRRLAPHGRRGQARRGRLVLPRRPREGRHRGRRLQGLAARGRGRPARAPRRQRGNRDRDPGRLPRRDRQGVRHAQARRRRRLPGRADRPLQERARRLQVPADRRDRRRDPEDAHRQGAAAGAPRAERPRAAGESGRVTARNPFAARGKVDQIGIVVRDMEEAMRRYSQLLGIGGWLGYRFGPGTLGVSTYRGAPGEYEILLAIAGSRPQVELIQSLRGPSIFEEHLAEHGEGLHHLGFYVRGLDQAVAALAADGFEVIQSGGRYPGRERGGYAYFETRDELGLLAELIEWPETPLETDFTG